MNYISNPFNTIMGSHLSVEDQLCTNKEKLNHAITDIINEIESRISVQMGMHQSHSYYIAVLRDINACLLSLQYVFNATEHSKLLKGIVSALMRASKPIPIYCNAKELDLQIKLQSLIQERAILIVKSRGLIPNESEQAIEEEYQVLIRKIPSFFEVYKTHYRTLADQSADAPPQQATQDQH